MAAYIVNTNSAQDIALHHSNIDTKDRMIWLQSARDFYSLNT